MALKVLILRNKFETKKRELEDKRTELQALADEERGLERAIEEMGPETSDEDKEVVEGKVDDLLSKKEGLEAAVEALEAEIGNLEEEIKAEEEKEPKPEDRGLRTHEQRGAEIKMIDRTKFFGMNTQERDAFFAREDVKDFLQRVRMLGGESRSVKGSELLIPEVMLDLIKDETSKNSKLIKKVRFKPVKAKVRENVAGTIPMGIWTEMIGRINELTFTFNQVEADGYKVSGFVPVPNSTLEDSDIDLATELIDGIGQAIGYALDAAILYGTGVKMPLGIVTRLAQTTKPADYPPKAPEWKDLSATNIIKMASLEGAKFYSALIKSCAAAKSKYSKGGKFWCMNETTYADVMAKSVATNMNGAFVAALNNTMPIINGEIILLDFIPDGDIIGGYGDLYLLIERAGIKLTSSEHVMFLDDNTVFKGTARYDGTPVIANGFVAININNAAVATTFDFAEDIANKEQTPATE